MNGVGTSTEERPSRFLKQRTRRHLLLLSLLVVVTTSVGQASSGTDGIALFRKGVTWQVFIDGVVKHARLWHNNASWNGLAPELVGRLRRVGEDLKLLIVAEDWCIDSVHTVPYIARVVEMSAVELRIVNRAVGSSLMRRYVTPDGRQATPIVVLVRSGRDVAVWVERPRALQTWYSAMEKRFDLGQRLVRKDAWYAWDRGDTTIAEIVQLAEDAQRSSDTLR
jgi:hypothetical protein